MQHDPVVAGVLATPAGIRAVLDGDVGTLVRLVRQAHGWRQFDLGRAAGYSQPTISRLEQGRGRITDIGVLKCLGQILAIPQAALGLAEEFASGHSQPPRRNLPDVQRSEFLRGMLGAAAALALPRAVANDDAGAATEATVRDCQAALGRLYDLDQRFGGNQVYEIAAHMVDRMRRTLRRASYSAGVGRALQQVVAATSEHAAWLAFDSGREDEARRWWLESLHLSDLGSAQEARVIALTSMALMECEVGDESGGREAVALVDAARRTTGFEPSHRLSSLLSARDALGHARASDRLAAISSLTAAAALLDRDPVGDDDEPAWLRFWSPADFMCHETRVAVMLGDLGRAEAAARAALGNADGVRYPRNQAIYSARLGSVLVRAGKLEEGIAVTRPIVLQSRGFASRRIEREVLATVERLDQRRDYPAGRAFATWSRRMLRTA